MQENFEINDSKAKDLVIDIAKALGLKFKEENDEFTLELTKEYGSGYVKAYQFDFGLSVIEVDFLLKEDFHLQLQKKLVHPLKILFNRESSFFQSFENEESLKEIQHLENVMMAGSPTNNHYFKIPSDQPICFFSLEINRKKFEEKIESFAKEMNSDLVNLFRDVNGINNFFYKNYYSLEIAKFIEEFTECDLSGFMRRVYLEGKAYEILVHQLKQYLDDLNDPPKRTILRKATINSIENAVSIIKEEIDGLTNVSELAKRVGLNQNTLQNGFKQIYKTSVNDFIKNYRIETAKELFETTGMNITEVTYKVGINSRSYFTKLFKKKYGVNPRDYLKQVRKKKSA